MHEHHVPAGTAPQYTCPMHPEVVRSGPGHCPKCGMALVPREAAPVNGHPDAHGPDMRVEEHRQLLWPHYLNLMLGLWLVASPRTPINCGSWPSVDSLRSSGAIWQWPGATGSAACW